MEANFLLSVILNVMLMTTNVSHGLPFGLQEDSEDTSILSSGDSNTLGGQKNAVSERCCHNGGTCYLGSFCICPPTFFGRYCEYEDVGMACGPLKHGEIIRQDCNLCSCIDGTISCIPHIFHGCDVRNVDLEVKVYNLTADDEMERAQGEKMLQKLVSGGPTLHQPIFLLLPLVVLAVWSDT